MCEEMENEDRPWGGLADRYDYEPGDEDLWDPSWPSEDS